MLCFLRQQTLCKQFACHQVKVIETKAREDTHEFTLTKTMKDDDLEAFLDMLERIAGAAAWQESTWAM